MSKPSYLPQPFFMVRAPLWPFKECEKLLNETHWEEATLSLYKSSDELQEAIAVASLSLYKSLSHNPSTAAIKSLHNYILRMTARSTPFGLFSLVATGEWSELPTPFFNHDNLEKRARPDLDWIYGLTRKSYDEKKNLEALTVRTNPLHKVVGDRITLDFLRMELDKSKEPDESVSIRNTGLVRLVLSLSEHSILVTDLMRKLDDYSDDLEQVKTLTLLHELVKQQILLPGILPSLIDPDLFKKLTPFFNQSAFDSYNTSSIGSGLTPLRLLIDEMEEKQERKAYIQVDTTLKERSITLPHSIGTDASEALSLLWTLSSGRCTTNTLTSYHGKFLEHYGCSRTVPILDLLHPIKGLGMFKTSEMHETKGWQAFQEKCAHHLEESLLEGKRKWELTLEEVDECFSISKETPLNPENAQLSFDLFCKLIADSPEALQSGKYQLLMGMISAEAGSSFGRFLDTMDTQTSSQVSETHSLEESLEESSTFVEISYFPLSSRGANVSIQPLLRKKHLDLEAKQMTSSALSLNDIYVGATLNRLYLTTREGDTEIIPRVGNMLSARKAPDPIRFMREICLQKYNNVFPFSWGNLDQRFTFFPRVSFKKTILSPATWICRPSHFSSKKNLKEEFLKWVKKWNLPNEILYAEGDNKLFLHLDYPHHIDQLIANLKKKKTLVLEEAFSSCWLTSKRGAHLSELVIPFVRKEKQTTKPILSTYQEIDFNERVIPPGVEWLYYKIYLPRDFMDDFLKDHIHPVMNELLEDEKWFFLRYGDSSPHLRLRIHSSDKNCVEKFAQVILLWLKLGLIQKCEMSTYEREIERYGGVEEFKTWERFFCADSLSIIPLLHSKLAPPILHALAIITFLKGFNLSNQEMIAFLGPRDQERLRGYKKYKNELISHAKSFMDEESFIVSMNQRKGWDRPSRPILHSLLHMHCNRLGADPEAEKTARCYAHKALQQLVYISTKGKTYAN